jgi:putative colanic acid biosynthesis acetyltransferase WcaF
MVFALECQGIKPSTVAELTWRVRRRPSKIEQRLTVNLRNYTTAGFDRGAPKWMEILWILLRCAFFVTPIPYPSALKTGVLRWFGAKVGRRVVIRSMVNISFPWRLEIGDDVWIGEGVWILSLASVTVESNVCVSQRSYLCSGTHEYRKDTFDLVTKPIRVREGSWIAAGAFVGPGVEIGPNSVISAGSVALRNVAAHTVVRGNPAQVIKESVCGS